MIITFILGFLLSQSKPTNEHPKGELCPIKEIVVPKPEVRKTNQKRY